MISVSIVGGSGYTGGEVLRLLLSHPRVELFQVTSESRLENSSIRYTPTCASAASCVL